ncbi:MAG: GNAT family N-acetyltransferase [Armatimonadota bacterium]|jgi:GNAT superfamily N-acetyltransferase|nr:GNAT family N-acetyltransferase [candidate division WS1 bacterium]
MARRNPMESVSGEPMGKHVDVRMDRPDLEGLPPIEVPAGYELITFSPGLFEEWVALLDRCFPELEPFDKGKWASRTIERAQFMPEGTFFVRHSGSLVATAFCWLDEPDERELGRVHWVGAEDAHRGRSLGRLVTVAVLHHMVSVGLKRAMLDTQDYRLPAVNLYLKLGFVPTPQNEAQVDAWRRVLSSLGRSDIPLSAGPFEQLP